MIGDSNARFHDWVFLGKKTRRLQQPISPSTGHINHRFDARLLQPLRLRSKLTSLATGIGTLLLLAVGSTEITQAQQKNSLIIAYPERYRIERYRDIQIGDFQFKKYPMSVGCVSDSVTHHCPVRYGVPPNAPYDFEDFFIWKSLVANQPRKTPNGLPNLNWDVVLAVNKTTAIASQEDLLLNLVIRILLIALLVVAIAAFLFKWGISPILDATNEVGKLGQGELDTQIDAKGEDELASLGFQINSMADQLKVLVREQAEQSYRQQAEAKRRQIFTDITLRIRQFLSQKDIFETTVEEIRNLLGADRVIICRLNEDLSGTVIAESVAAGWSKTIGKQMDNPCFTERDIQQYKNGRVDAIDNIYQAHITDFEIKRLEQFAVQASLVAPILQEKQLVSLLIVHQCRQPRAWLQWEIDLFTQLAIQVGFALDQGLLLEQVEKARLHAEVVSQEQRQQKETLQQKLIEMLSSIEAASKGDLTVRAEVTAGEIGTVADFFNSIIESLRQIVTAVKKAAQEVNVSTEENSDAVQQLALIALKQAEEITRTLEGVNQMTLSIQAVADSAIQAAEVARSAFDIAKASGSAMDRTVQSILNLQQTVTETAKKVNRLGESSQQISRVVSLINEISLQTNLLSINAGLEIGRMGNEGLGFAVVAEEIGELAAQSAQATREVQQILENIQLETTGVVKAMKLGRTQVVEGANLVKDAKLSLEQILELSGQIDHLVQSISSATVSQANTSQAVTILMKEIALVSESSSDSSRIVSTSLQKTLAVAQQLLKSAGVFKTGD